MFDTIVVSGGNIQKDFALDFLGKIIEKQGRKNLLMIAADKGLEFFQKTSWKPDVTIGDFDSLSPEKMQFLEDSDFELIRLKPEKDDSDTQSAVKLAMARGAKKILIFGATGTRLDHVMANIETLSMAETQGVKVSLVDANNYMTIIKSETILSKNEQFGKYVSFFPLGGDVTGLTLDGFLYPLFQHHLKVSDGGLTVSNEIRDEYAKITYGTGKLLMIMSRD